MSDDERDLASAVNDATPTDPPPYADVLARRDRRRTRRRAVVASAGAAALVAAVLGGTAALGGDEPTGLPPAVSSSTPPTPSETPETAQTNHPAPDVPPEWDEQGAPPVVLQLDGRAVRLEPWTACYTGKPDENGISNGRCYDGMPVPPFEDVGDRDTVSFSFPIKGWTFTATFKASGTGDCDRRITVPVKKTGDYTFSVPTAGPAGSYDVDIFGRGPGGDVVTTFAWSTTEAGQLPGPSGAVAFLTDEDDDGIVSYGTELTISDLAETPREASATLMVTAPNGSFEHVGPLSPQPPCGEGTLFFREELERRVLDLGPGPYHYRVELTLDGTTYLGTATWPRDENDQAPYTDLTFDPPLPAFTG